MALFPRLSVSKIGPAQRSLLVSSSTLPEHLGFNGFDKQNQALFNMQFEFDNACCLPKEDIRIYTAELPTEISTDNTTYKGKCISEQRYHLIKDTYESNGVSSQIQQLSEGDQVGGYPRAGIGKPSEDGYNWKKYGQKQVKGSEYPRSYYKCTHPTCPVKKKVERALDGQIREIIYSGSHNHPQPQASHQSASGSSHAPNDMAQDSTVVPHKDWGVDSNEMTSSASAITDPDSISTAKRKNSGLLTDDTNFLSSQASQDDDENGVTQGSILQVEDGELDETESKRRRIEYSLIESSSISRAIREQRVIVQTVSEMDILEDGYRWRKYGQKVVKGNPNPRSYYKCTNPGCPVRKHIERAPNDLRSVITTYEGKHNHEVPTCRAINDIAPSGNSHLLHAQNLPGSTNALKNEPRSKDFFSCFGNNLEFCGNYLKPSYLGSVGDSTVVPPFSDVKLPPMPYFPLHQMIPIPKIPQEWPVPFPMGINGPNSMASSYGITRGRSSISELHSLCVQMPNVDHMRILRPPKKEVDAYGSPESPLSYAQQLSPP